MAPQAKTLPSLKREALPPGEDPRALFNEGLDWLRQLAGAQWTDHNIHDPGITTLEMLSMALAEQGYRAGTPIEDWLAEPVDPATGAPPALARQFYGPRASLPNRPLTTLDWRKLLIDLDGVKNAWVAPVPFDIPFYADQIARELVYVPPAHGHSKPVGIDGLYQVRIDFMDHIGTQADKQTVLARVKNALEANRNLCEDFLEPQEVAVQYFSLCAEIDLDTQADVTEAAAQLLFVAENTLAPQVPCYSLAQMRERLSPSGQPYRIDEIFDGPLLENGFIDERDLQASELPSSLRLSDLIGELMDVPGVHAIATITVNPLDEDAFPVSVPNPWQIPVAAGHMPRLALYAKKPQGRLVLRKRGVPVSTWNMDAVPAAVMARLNALREAERAAVETDRADVPAVPQGRWRDLAEYRSIQRDFPVIYGLGPTGLPRTADEARKAHQLQWRAYLMLFDQQMANDMAQMKRARELLSVWPQGLADEAERLRDDVAPFHALTSQPVRDDFIPTSKLFTQPLSDTQLTDLIETEAQALARRDRQLDHLLARIGEDFSAYASIMASVFDHTQRKVLADKCEFLAQAPALTANRAGAYRQYPDEVNGVWNSDNISGIEQRISYLLGIQDVSRRNLATVSYDAYPQIDQTPNNEFRYRVVHGVTDKILLSSTTYFKTPEEARQQMISAIAAGQELGHYRWHEGKDGQFYFRVVDPADDKKVLGRRNEGFESEEAALTAMQALRDYLQHHYSGEGLYVLEGLLLRPRTQGDPLMPICLDNDCDECTDVDPYSWRLFIVLPAYAGRFQDMRFREFAERVIRAEVPAHIIPRICWVNSDDMARFEGALRDWIQVHAGQTHADRNIKLRTLIEVLSTIKSVYPQRTLYDCAADVPPKEPFVLGRTALGSIGTTHISAPKETDHG
ncbi:MAG: diguanylate cyclase [Aquabacterium sp.]|uniref:hypothetical protein n=1 Tax=Aquabacterium sp. TaxID=1872578 RepID=UPI0025C17662|nr:hypothetical protein [Aquabacterium sp.]MBI5926632.1 diguanylate cyclase [Aquabacterium sp.]